MWKWREQMSDNINNTDNSDNEYEKICYICRRPESKAGKMISMPNNIYICADCMREHLILLIIVELTMMI